MEQEFNSDMLVRLRNGEKVTCQKCNVGIFVTRKGFEKIAHCYWCNNCGESVEFLPNITIE